MERTEETRDGMVRGATRVRKDAIMTSDEFYGCSSGLEKGLRTKDLETVEHVKKNFVITKVLGIASSEASARHFLATASTARKRGLSR